MRTRGVALTSLMVACSARPPDDVVGTSRGGAPSGSGGTFGGGFPGTGSDSSAGGILNFGGSLMGPDGGCGALEIDTSVEEVVTPGNVLIIFDQSDSMSMADFNGQVRWQAASQAVVDAITPLQNSLTIGAIFFPSVAGLSFVICDPNTVNPITTTTGANPQIPFMPGSQFLQAWSAHWALNPLTLGTPIDAGLQRGDEALSSSQLTGSTIVLFVTDGVPTCSIGNDTTALPAKWLGLGIPTHVIGLPGAGQSVLQSIATSGGTQNFLLPSDGAQLAQQLSAITSTIVKHSLDSCTIKLSEKPPGNVVLAVTQASDGQQYAVETGPDGWTLADDGLSATLNGATCTDATSGRFSKLSFVFACRHIPPLR